MCRCCALKNQLRVKDFKWVLALVLAALLRPGSLKRGRDIFQCSVSELGQPTVSELYPSQMELQAGPNYLCTSLIRLDPRCCG